ncbi:MAG: PKD domain-containing protein [Bacteroidales bacterium]|nr:PKD domain-containing protein [Bacteroidales bacterium]
MGKKAFILKGFWSLMILITFLPSIIAQKDTTFCEANFTFEIYQELNKPSVIQFTDQSEGFVANWEWSFGDGSTSQEQNPIHFFPENNDFEVTLFISSGECADEITKTVQIRVPLDVSFSFKLDSNNIFPNTFIFSTTLTGYYDQHIWDFGDGVLAQVEDTIHTYLKQDTDYQICLTALYTFNDTSSLSKTSCAGLTTSEYYDIGGQVFFSDSLLNNPSSTGDTALAYLYRLDGNKVIPIDTNYYINLGYYWFAQRLKAYYIIKTGLLPHSKHYNNYAPTYVGNTTQWDEAEIINLAQDRYREDIHLIEKENTNMGSGSLDGSVFDILNIDSNYEKAIVCLFDLEENLIDYQNVDNYGNYIFTSLSKGHYMLSADLIGIPVRPQLIYIDGKNKSDFKNTSLSSTSTIFPNPASEYCIFSYENKGDTKSISLQLISSQGIVVQENSFISYSGTNYIRIDMSDLSKGLYFIQVVGENILSEKILHY